MNTIANYHYKYSRLLSTYPGILAYSNIFHDFFINDCHTIDASQFRSRGISIMDVRLHSKTGFTVLCTGTRFECRMFVLGYVTALRSYQPLGRNEVVETSPFTYSWVEREYDDYYNITGQQTLVLYISRGTGETTITR